MKRKFETMRIEELLHLHVNNRIAYPENIQRDEVWQLTQKKNFMCSVLSGMNVSAILLLDTYACREWNRTYGKIEDVKFFEGFVDDNYSNLNNDGQQKTWSYVRYINNDGQQKTWSYVRYINNEFAVDTGIFEYLLYKTDEYTLDENGNIKYPHYPYTDHTKTSFVSGWLDADKSWEMNLGQSPKLFRELDLELQTALKNQIIPIIKILGCTKKQAHLLFNVVNAGVTQNPQEFRQAFDVPIANKIREWGKEFEKYYVKVGLNNTRKDVDQNIVEKNDWYVSRKPKSIIRIDGFDKGNFFDYQTNNYMYKDDSEHEKDYKNNDLFETILRANMSSYPQDKKNKKLKEWGTRQDFTWFQILSLILPKYKISNITDAFGIFYEQEIARRRDKTTIVYDNKNGKQYAYSSATSLSDESMMNTMLNIALKDFLSNKKAQSFIKPRTSSKRGTITIKDRFDSFERQKGINPVDGNKMDIIDVLNSSDYELDHLIRLEDGGEDTLENRFLINKNHHKIKTKLEHKGIKFNCKEDYKKILNHSSERVNIVPISSFLTEAA